MTEPTPEPKHCDDYIDDPAQPLCLRVFLERARSPGHGMTNPEPYPVLFATYRGEHWAGVDPNTRVRVVMASRMGDVGVTTNLTQSVGYQLRCFVEQLSDFAETP